MKLYEALTIDDVYPALCEDILVLGEEHSPRGMLTKDLGSVAIVINEPWSRIITNRRRKINPYFMFAEFLWIVTRSHRADMVAFYNKKMWDFSDDGQSLYGAYGPRIMYQIPSIVQKIKQDPHTRQAIATIFKPKDQIVITKDFPCNIMLHFLPRKEKLDLIAYARSQDVFLGLPYDFYHWSLILEMVANTLGMQVGQYTHICGSIHAYERDFERLDNIANTEDEDILPQFEEALASGLPDNIRTISTVEYKNRKSTVLDFDDACREIGFLKEPEIIKNHLKALAYYKIRPKAGQDKAQAIAQTGYEDLLVHLGWQ